METNHFFLVETITRPVVRERVPASPSSIVKRTAVGQTCNFPSQHQLTFIFGINRRTRQENSPMSENITHVTDATFSDDVLKSDTPVLVDFWAEWCGPCKMIAPVLEEVAVSHAGKIKIAKVDVDDNREVAAKYGIRGIPTLLLFKNGELAAQKVGALSKAQLTAFVDSNV
jgi:thioredoxin 1